MQAKQSRRSFLTTFSSAGVAGIIACEFYAQEAPPETTTVRLAKIRHLHRAAICRRGPAARRRLHRCPLRATDAGMVHAERSRRRDRLHLELRAALVIPIDAGETITIVGRRACRLLRAVRERSASAASPTSRARPSACKTWARARTCSCRAWRPMSGSTRPRTSTGSPARRPQPMELFAEGKIDAFSASRPSRRNCAPARSAT